MKWLQTEELVARIRRIQAEIRDRVVAHMEAQGPEMLAAVVVETASD